VNWLLIISLNVIPYYVTYETGSKCGNGLSFYALPPVLSSFYGTRRESFEWFVSVHFAGSLSSLEKIKRGTAVTQWLRFCATNRKVVGSIPDGVIGIFH